MNSRAKGRRFRPSPIVGAAFVPLGFALLGIIVGASVSAHAQPTYFDSTRVMGHGGNECGAVPSCRTIKTHRKIIGVGQSNVLSYNCPAHTPYLVGWDTEQLEQMQVQVVPHAFNPQSDLSVAVENRGSTPGYVKIFLGCSTKKVSSIAMMHQRGGIPSQAAGRPRRH
jgi:hypothetical protein